MQHNPPSKAAPPAELTPGQAPWPFAPLTELQQRDRAALERALRADRLAAHEDALL